MNGHAVVAALVGQKASEGYGDKDSGHHAQCFTGLHCVKVPRQQLPSCLAWARRVEAL